MNWTIIAICNGLSHEVLPTSNEKLLILCKLMSPSLLWPLLPTILRLPGKISKISY